MGAITDKQRKVIDYIEENLDFVKFTGETKRDARDFINALMSLSKERARENARRRWRDPLSRPQRIIYGGGTVTYGTDYPDDELNVFVPPKPVYLDNPYSND